MALAANPFGFRPYGGHSFKTTNVLLAATHVAIGKGDVMYETNSGALPCRSDTDTAQIGLLGIASQNVAANTGGFLECWAIEPECKFTVQSADVSTTIGTDISIARSTLALIANKACHTTTGESTQSVSLTGTDIVASPLVAHFHAPVPGNTPNTAASYPILVVSFRRATLDAGTAKLGDGILA